MSVAAHITGGPSAWADLSEEDRGAAVADALPWLRALRGVRRSHPVDRPGYRIVLDSPEFVVDLANTGQTRITFTDLDAVANTGPDGRFGVNDRVILELDNVAAIALIEEMGGVILHDDEAAAIATGGAS